MVYTFGKWIYTCPECGGYMGWSANGKPLKHWLCPNCRLRVDVKATPDIFSKEESRIDYT
jgi:DNA-directed RNA polymerase subunit RPC12/RpoP